MYSALNHTHSLLRWFALIAIVIAIFRGFSGMRESRVYTSIDKRWALITLIVFHLQLLIGLALYFLGNWHTELGNMKDPVSRFYSLEHAAVMLIAIALVTLGYGKAKRARIDLAKHRTTFRFYIIALILVIISIPWPFREAIGKPLFPGL